MTRVSFIAGIGKAPQLALPKRKAAKRFINFGAMTDGELRMILFAEQLNILAQYYGSDEHNQVEQAILQSIKDGNTTAINAIPGDLANSMKQEFAKSSSMRRPAAGTFSKSRTKTSVGDTLIEVEDCNDYIVRGDDGRPQYLPGYDDCVNRQEGITLLNNHLEESSHHLMYEFLSTTDAANNGTALAKRVDHRNAISKLAEITNLSRDNVSLWTRNGVLRNNVAFGAPPLQPEDAIQALQIGADPSVGAFPVAALVAALPAIISALTGAVIATVTLVNNLRAQKQQQLLQAAQGIGTTTFGPEPNDWYAAGVTPTNNNLISNDNLPLLLGGGALLLLLNNQ